MTVQAYVMLSSVSLGAGLKTRPTAPNAAPPTHAAPPTPSSPQQDARHCVTPDPSAAVEALEASLEACLKSAAALGGAAQTGAAARLVVTSTDAKQAIYRERMEQLRSWMRHYRFGLALRRRTRRFFKEYYASHSAIDDNAILADLAPDLQRDGRRLGLPPLAAVRAVEAFLKVTREQASSKVESRCCAAVLQDLCLSIV